MNRLSLLIIAITSTAIPAAKADVFFTDNFSNGSTLNGVSVPGGTPMASKTSYDIASTKNATSCTLAANDLTLRLNAATTSGFVEAQALFTTNAVALSAPGDYIDLTFVFTNTTGTLLVGGTSSDIWLGLYNSGGSAPLPGNLTNSGLSATAGSAYASGNCANWQGFAAQISSNGTTRLYTRPLQNGSGTTSANQDLVGNGAGGGAFNNPGGTTLSTYPTTAITLTSGGVYTMQFMMTLLGTSTLMINNNLYTGVGTGGTILISQAATNNNPFVQSFDGLCIGTRNSGTSLNPIMDISSIVISGQSTVITNPPTITSEPSPVSVPAGASCAFSVSATGFGVTYQWHRNGTNLINDGNISGANSDLLAISPASAADVASGPNGYYVTVSGAGGFSTNSFTNSLSLRVAANLIWSGSGSTWDLNTSADWLSGANASVFNFGDFVTFDDTGAANSGVTLSGPYLSASAVTVNSSADYVFQGSGNFAGGGQLRYIGGGHLTLNNANSYSGGTLISNATAFLVLNNYNALGTGPVTLGMAGGQMELVNAGAAGYGINGDVNVADDFTFIYDSSSSFGAVLLGNLSGTLTKTLTINYNNTGTNQSRVRIYGISTVYDGNLVLTDPRTVWAPYQPSGTQIYNGIISGAGMLIQRGSGSTILNGLNTYSGGTTPTTGSIGFGVDTAAGLTAGPIGTGPLLLAPEVPNTTGSGHVFAYGGARIIANPVQYPSATNNLTLVVDGTNDLTFSGQVTLNGNDGTGSVNRTFQVTNSGLTTILGPISDGGLNCGLIKIGNGVLALNNTETYTGPTTANGGILQINGQLAGGAVTVGNNGMLGGTGTIGGPVTVQTNGTISPGDSIGTLTINNNLTLSGNLLIEVNRSASPSSDKIVVSGVLTNGWIGAVTVTNLGPALAPNDTFTLFSQPVLNGGALRITGGGQGVNWTNKLAVDGTIAVSSLVPTTPTNITFSASGGLLSLSWPANYVGWTLEGQTNAPGVGITTNWVRMPASTTVNQMSFAIGPTNRTVFFRLVYP